MTITTELLTEFKERMRISHSSEDNNLKRLLSFSYAYLIDKCGEFDINQNLLGKELVMERARYSYNDAVEFFEDNFLSQIHSLGFDLANFEGDEE
ncbi:phage gp6-like head-tail connector protein [Cytobacillus sp. FSL R5-0569]|uniref:phage gp6-like head-tail connector protein n=1 Tax=Cytobacillus sp. FSL R5-0569 TaxID=2921649 RepID=UPI0030F5C632